MRKKIIILTAILFVFRGFLVFADIFAQEKSEKLMLKAVYVMFPDSTVKHISPTPGEGFYATACIHPEGRAVVFSGGARGYSRIWKYDFAKGRTFPITPDSFVSTLPSYSWDGRLIVFSADRDLDQKRYDMYEIGRSIDFGYGFIGGKPENLNLYVMGSEGNNIRQITRGKFQDASATHAPSSP